MQQIPSFTDAEMMPCIGGCGRMGTNTWEWAPGHISGKMCDYCVLERWEETQRNLTESIANLKARMAGADVQAL